MPNHTSTKLVVSGPQGEIEKFISLVDKGDVTHFDFNAINSCPEELLEISSPVRIGSQEEIDEQWASFNKLPDDRKKMIGERPFGLRITGETYKRLIESYGASDWYHWCVENWGTKWNAYYVGEWNVSDGEATIFYQTAWSPATPLLIRASELFPSLVFKHSFADEGGGFLGYESIMNGKVAVTAKFDWHSDDGKNLRIDLGCYCESEEDQEELQTL